MSKAETQPNVFTDALRDLNKGRTMGELSEKLMEVLAAVKRTGKKGSLSFKLTVSPVPKTEGSQVAFDDDVTIKLPQPDRKSKIFYLTQDSLISRTDPDQTEMNFEGRVVEGGLQDKESPKEERKAQ